MKIDACGFENAKPEGFLEDLEGGSPQPWSALVERVFDEWCSPSRLQPWKRVTSNTRMIFSLAESCGLILRTLRCLRLRYGLDPVVVWAQPFEPSKIMNVSLDVMQFLAGAITSNTVRLALAPSACTCTGLLPQGGPVGGQLVTALCLPSRHYPTAPALVPPQHAATQGACILCPYPGVDAWRPLDS